MSRLPARVLPLVALALLAGALVAGYLVWRPATAPHAAPERLRIALSATPHAALLHIAAGRGYLAEVGLDVAITPVSHGKAAIDLLSRGEVDLATAAEVPFVIAVMNGEPFGVAATVVSVASEMAVVARADRTIRAPRDLAGRKIGLTFGTSGEYFLWALLIRHMVPPEAVTLVNLPPNLLPQEIMRGHIDAVATWQPLVAEAQAALAGGATTFTEPHVYAVTHVVVGRTPFLTANGSAIRKLVQALLMAEQFNQDEPEQALAMVAARLGLDTRMLRPAWKDLKLRVDLRQSQLITMEDQARWAVARGYVSSRTVPNLLPHLYLDALQAVRPERVSVVR